MSRRGRRGDQLAPPTNATRKPLDSIWCSIFLAWLIKATVLKGAALHRKTVPFFLGVALGQIVAAGCWLPVDGFNGTVAIACPFTKFITQQPKGDEPVDIQTIQHAIDALPRHHLTNLPTPLAACPRLSAELGGPRIWIKRDDMTGLAFGGNKSRYLEFTLAEATAQGCDAAVLSSVVQSNHCRQFAAACARIGLKGVVVLREDDSTMGRKEPAQGNYLLDQLCGARIRFAPPGQIGAAVEEEKERLAKKGYKPFTGLSGMLSRIAYIQCALEIETQCLTEGIEPGHLVIGSGGTSLAGLVAGYALLGRPLHFLGTPQSKMGQTDGVSARIAQSAVEAAAHIGLACSADPAQITVTDAYVGPGFGYLDQATLDSIRLLAGCEGILVDPTYSGKAFTCLIDQLRQGRFNDSEDIVFVHTGGTPLLFAYGEALLA